MHSEPSEVFDPCWHAHGSQLSQAQRTQVLALLGHEDEHCSLSSKHRAEDKLCPVLLMWLFQSPEKLYGANYTR